jgi:hypothetical protein
MGATDGGFDAVWATVSRLKTNERAIPSEISLQKLKYLGVNLLMRI